MIIEIAYPGPLGFDDIMDWCEEQISPMVLWEDYLQGAGDWAIELDDGDIYDGLVFHFRNPNNALLFKLAFGGK